MNISELAKKFGYVEIGYTGHYEVWVRKDNFYFCGTGNTLEEAIDNLMRHKQYA